MLLTFSGQFLAGWFSPCPGAATWRGAEDADTCGGACLALLQLVGRAAEGDRERDQQTRPPHAVRHAAVPRPQQAACHRHPGGDHSNRLSGTQIWNHLQEAAFEFISDQGRPEAVAADIRRSEDAVVRVFSMFVMYSSCWSETIAFI